MYDQNRFEGIGKAGKPAVKRMYYHKTKYPGSSITNPTNSNQIRSTTVLKPIKVNLKIDFDAKGQLWFTYMKEFVKPDGKIVMIPTCGKYASALQSRYLTLQQ